MCDVRSRLLPLCATLLLAALLTGAPVSLPAQPDPPAPTSPSGTSPDTTDGAATPTDESALPAILRRHLEPPAPPRRGDLGFAVVRFEREFFARERAPEEIRRANEAFDRASGEFVKGDFRAAFHELNDEYLQLRFGEHPDLLAELAASLTLAADPAVANRQADRAIYKLALHQQYPLKANSLPFNEVIVLADADGYIHWGGEFRGKLDPARYYSDVVTPYLRQKVLMEGEFELQVRIGDPVNAPDDMLVVPIGRVWSSEVPVEKVKADVLGRLDAWETLGGAAQETPTTDDTAALALAGALLRSRANLLSERPSADWSAQFFVNHAKLARDVEAEMTSIEEGRDPFANRPGDTWFSMTLGGVEVPLRVHVPAAVLGSEPLPVVFAFHGAGGDENMWAEAYGAGRLPELAEQEGFLLVAPLSYPIANAPALAGEVLDVMDSLYDVDRERVFVVGHSMGGGVAAQVAPLVGAKAAAFVASAPATNDGAAPAARCLYIAGGQDPVVPPQRVEAAANAVRDAGAEVEFRQFDDHGHTLLVGTTIPDVVEWLLHSRSPEPAETTAP
jgi:poly(3-hydroxybutyrate) depolymerase